MVCSRPWTRTIPIIFSSSRYAGTIPSTTGSWQRSPDKPDRTVHGILVFIDPSLDPKTQPWHRVGRSGEPGFEVFFLREALASLAQRVPNHPLLAVLSPLMERSDEAMRTRAESACASILDSGLADETRETQFDIFFDWLLMRFPSFDIEALRTMIELRPIDRVGCLSTNPRQMAE